MARKQQTNHSVAGLPNWAQKLAQRYYTRTVSTFVVYGAVRDLQPVSRDKRGGEFTNLKQFLFEELFGGRDHVVFYDRSAGVRLPAPETQQDFNRLLTGYDALLGTKYAKGMPRDPAQAPAHFPA